MKVTLTGDPIADAALAGFAQVLKKPRPQRTEEEKKQLTEKLLAESREFRRGHLPSASLGEGGAE